MNRTVRIAAVLALLLLVIVVCVACNDSGPCKSTLPPGCLDRLLYPVR